MTPEVLFGLIAVCAVVFLILRRRHHTGQIFSPYYTRPLMTKHEIAMAGKLMRATRRIGSFHVCPQVSMGAFLEVKKHIQGKDRLSARNRYDRKVCDFAIIDASARVLCVIELDDWSHDNKQDKDQKRDAMLHAAGVPTIRFRNASRLSEQEIIERIRPHLT